MIRRAILKGVAIPGYQVPFASREMPMPYGWGTGGVQVTAACLVPEDRLKVVDFVTYSKTALCVFGRADNPKVANAKSIDEFNQPGVTVAYFTGGGEENWVKKRFPNATLRGVSTAGTAAPVEEIMAKRADITPINRVPWQALNRKVKGLKALPEGNNCQDSNEMATPIGLAIDKNQPEYLNWLKAVNDGMKAKLDADEARIINTM